MANPYESSAQKNIPAVLIYARHADFVLMIHRDSKDRPGDHHAGKWNGLGGKSELGESFSETAAREFQEKAGVAVPVERFRFLGLLQFPNFKPKKNEDWTVGVFSVELTLDEKSRVPLNNAEGSLHWIQAEKLSGLNLWAGDREFIPFVMRDQPFVGCTWYDGEVVKKSILSPIH